MNTQEETMEKMPEHLKTYIRPMIVYETELETRAGSPLGHEDFADPLGIIEP